MMALRSNPPLSPNLAGTDDILTELKHNSKVKFKETDLFRVYQSIDLVSVSFSRASRSFMILLFSLLFLNPPSFYRET